MKHPDDPLEQRAHFPLAKRLSDGRRYRELKRRLARSRLRHARRLSLWLTPLAPEPGPIEIEIISIRAIIGGSLTLPLHIHWHGAIYAFELARVVPEARDADRAAFHQALRTYFTAADEAAREWFERIGYRLPSLDAGDIVLIGALAFIVTLDGEFALATHNRGVGAAALLTAARRDPHCRLSAPRLAR